MNALAKRILTALLCALLLASCAQLTPRDDPPPDSTGDPAADRVYHSLAADIAARRGLLEEAFGHYVWLARDTRDVIAAEKAARIGLHLGKNGETLQAAELWSTLAPEDPGAFEVRAILLVREGRADEAYETLKTLIALTDAEGKRGYVEAAGVLAAVEERALGESLMRRLVSDRPGYAEAHYAYALVLLAYQDLVRAEAQVGRALALRPENELAWLLLSRIRQGRGLEEAAGAALGKGVASNPGSRLLRIAYARWLVEARRYDKAYDQFRQLEQKSPNDPDLLFSLGALATDLEKWDAAKRYWKRLLALGERVDEARYFLAKAEEAAGNLAGALVLYRGVQRGLLRMEAAVRVAELLAARGETKEARRVLAQQRVLFAEHAPSLYMLEAEMLREQGDPDEAERVYDIALGAYPGDPELLYGRAMLAASRGRIDALERDLRAILEADPDHADALNALGYTLADQTQRYHEAFELISRALELKPESAAILDSMGWVQYRLGNLETALAYLRRAVAKDSDHEILAHLGEVLWVMGQRQEAREVWQRALEQDPDSTYVLDTMRRLQAGQ